MACTLSPALVDFQANPSRAQKHRLMSVCLHLFNTTFAWKVKRSLSNTGKVVCPHHILSRVVKSLQSFESCVKCNLYICGLVSNARLVCNTKSCAFRPVCTRQFYSTCVIQIMALEDVYTKLPVWRKKTQSGRYASRKSRTW